MTQVPAPAPDFTPTDDVFVRKHMGVPDIDVTDWALVVEGLVEHPLSLDMDAVLALGTERLPAFHECFGSPFAPDVPTRAVAQVEWAGVPLAALLDRAVPRAAARHVWFEGADTGSFHGRDGLTYVKDLPLPVARRDVFLAHRMNGEPLRAEHGFPLRAVVPRMFGTNSVKWLTRIVLADGRADSVFTTEFYNRVLPGDSEPSPVREVDVSSKLFVPGEGEQLPAGRAELSGRAWSATDVVGVEISVDGGPWEPAVVDPPGSGPTWQRFSLTRELAPGAHRIRCRARDLAGRVQPLGGARNSVHEVGVEVGE
ncbi:molybdopterin-dependent oxidoreductase [Streptomyces sp. BA2]|uniref:molybdopterin-dependent oxidoreductase n=1 Tax=Streptomyces sp. BA2 TaxID=436595 RepID=UPI00132A9086|nr:molybdopterin-dependent oxidoreductase [Streptomyces sp. BA2]MWA11148.1 molybdopterin-dependent oxidoreductase [Streptomyces sp. BA2]